MLRFRSYRRQQADVWGQLLWAPRPRLAPLLVSILRPLRPPRWLVRPLLPPFRPWRGRRRRPPSPYKRLLRAKQLFQRFYLLSRAYRLARWVRSSPPLSLLPWLEMLPTPLLVRSLLVATPFQARQLLAHGQVWVDGRPCSPFQPLRPGQLLQLAPPHRPFPPLRYRQPPPPRFLRFRRLLRRSFRRRRRRPLHPPGPPPYLEVSFRTAALLLLSIPRPSQLFFPFRPAPSSLVAFFRRS